MSKRRIFGALSLLVGIAIALAGAEALATAWFTLRDGKYTPAAELFDKSGNTYISDVTKGRACRYIDTLFPHPYLAYVHHHTKPCGVPNANNVGMIGDDYPFVRRDDRYVILLTGGSVASQVGQLLPPPAPKFLEAELNTNYTSPNGKPFLVLNGGAGAWKQPQQSVLLSLFGDVIDAVVTLDGFNEMLMFNPTVNTRFDTPSPNFFDLNPLIAQGNFGDVVLGWITGQVVAWTGQSVLRHSHAAYLVATGITRLGSPPDAGRASNTFWGMYILPDEIRSDPGRHFDWQLGQYRKYIRLMNASAQGLGLKSMFFLQPVPAIDKVLTEEEKKTSGDLSYGPRYARIVEDLLKLNSEAIAVRSLLDVFASEKRTIYEDWIHAYRTPTGDSPGYRLMAMAMASQMADAWGLQRKSQGLK